MDNVYLRSVFQMCISSLDVSSEFWSGISSCLFSISTLLTNIKQHVQHEVLNFPPIFVLHLASSSSLMGTSCSHKKKIREASSIPVSYTLSILSGSLAGTATTALVWMSSNAVSRLLHNLIVLFTSPSARLQSSQDSRSRG